MNIFKRLFEGSQLVRSAEILERFQAPRYSTIERDALFEPQQGQTIYNTTTDKLNFYTGSDWKVITSS